MDTRPKASIFKYFREGKKFLILTAVTGIIYNVGMTAGPWFEGQLAQYLFDILKGSRAAVDIVRLSLIYVVVIAAVQGARALKRLYVRKFANDVSRSMKESIYRHLVSESYAASRREDTGGIMTRAISDAEDCAEGMRKFTTELFDTGVVMIAYLVMLLLLDWRLTLIVIIFPPVAYVVSGALKGKVTHSSQSAKEAMSRLNNAAVDAAGNALTYRVYGESGNRVLAYEDALGEYESRNITAGIWQNSPQPVYLALSMTGVIPILLLGSRNVLGGGWTAWTIAYFSSFLSCFTKLATKSSHAAKLFNAVQKARVSWHRIEGYLVDDDEYHAQEVAEPDTLTMKNAGFSYGSGFFSLEYLNMVAKPGEIVGITGKVSSGKSTFGRIFLNEYPYTGSIRYGGMEISQTDRSIFAYAGHDPELFTGTVRDNVTFGDGDEERLRKVLGMVEIDGELTPDTMTGMEGTGLSGGQRARIALARALYSRAPVLILDDPFAAVDNDTEKRIVASLRENESWRIIMIISHRLELFPLMDQVIFIENGTMTSGTHSQMMENEAYAELYRLGQKPGSANERKLNDSEDLCRGSVRAYFEPDDSRAGNDGTSYELRDISEDPDSDKPVKAEGSSHE